MIAYVIAAVGILMVASIMHSSLNMRKRDFAIMRSLGSGRLILTGVIFGHSLIISVLGALGSLLIMQGIGLITQGIIVEETGVLLDGMNLQLQDLWVIMAIIFSGLVGGLGAAVNAYRSELVDLLQPIS